MKKYFKHKINNLLVVNSIVTVHYFEFDKNFKSETESHDFWEIVYAHKGDIVCNADGKDIILSQGEMLFHKPNENHGLKANGKVEPTVFIISFDCRSLAMRYFENAKIMLDSVSLKYVYSIMDEAKRSFNIPFSDPLTKKMEILDNASLGGVQMIKCYLEIMLVKIMRRLSQTENQERAFLTENELSDKLVEDVLAYLNENVCSTVTVDDICKKISYSKAYIFKKFKQVTGKTIIDYFTNLKIKKAKELIKEKNLSVKEISLKLGFDTPNYFSKTFKKKTGLTPLEFRKISN